MLRRLILLALVPNIAFALHNCKFSLSCSKKINLSELQAAVSAQAQGVTIESSDCHGDLSINGVIQPGTGIDRVITVRNIPDQYSCAQVGNFLQNHNPTKSTEEKEEETRQKSKLDILNDALPNTDVIKSIFQRLDTLEGN